ncbi:hypothetical protein [Solirubrobacter soli]|uniref:hypothetical protein n=1 Tax=Solirubrobacter soli TaxID=363832 RepID=UPI000428942A|nr:hypothetical protein [Solirubrobacter soli]
MKRILALAVLALAGCGAETQVAAPPRPITTSPQLSKACSKLPPAPPPSTAFPSPRLQMALGVLRRPKTAQDTPPADAFRDAPFVGGVMLGSARRVAGGWIVPVESVTAHPVPSDTCLRSMAPEQRRQVLASLRDPTQVEGVVLVSAGGQPAHPWSTDDIVAGRAFTIQGCTGPMRNRITISGIVPDGAAQVTVTARDGGIIQAAPTDNLVAVERDRPDSPAGLPAHITSTTTAKPLEYAIDPRTTRHLDEPCEPPSKQSLGQRLEPPAELPGGARLELTTSRWQPEDSGPLLAGATTRNGGRRCLLIDSEKRLRAGGSAHRFCVADAKLKAERFIVHATRLPSGDVILEGFVDRDRISYVLVERSTVASGAFVLRPAKRSGAFFIAIRGKHARGGTFTLHAARRGAPVRYTGMRTARLNPSP